MISTSRASACAVASGLRIGTGALTVAVLGLCAIDGFMAALVIVLALAFILGLAEVLAGFFIAILLVFLPVFACASLPGLLIRFLRPADFLTAFFIGFLVDFLVDFLRLAISG